MVVPKVVDDGDSHIQPQQNNAQAAYQVYINAYNQLTSLNSQGLGNTPQGKAAYEVYAKAKAAYEAAIK